jgi:hypothetical protein
LTAAYRAKGHVRHQSFFYQKSTPPACSTTSETGHRNTVQIR